MKKLVTFGLIYGAYCTISKKWYIGQTVQTLVDRKRGHKKASFNERYKGYNDLFHCAIRKYGIENFIWYVIEDNISVPYIIKNGKKIFNRSLLNKKEKYWIKKYNSFENGYNLTPGGASSCIYSIDVCAKPIRQYTLDGNKVKDYESTQEAARKTGIKQTSIADCGRYERKKAGEYMWKYLSDEKCLDKIEPYKKYVQPGKRIYQYLKDCITKVGEYESVQEAARKNKICQSNISYVLIGKRKFAGEYHWKYAQIW